MVSVIEKPVLLLLGGSGFIGRHLNEKLSSTYQVVHLSHKSSTLAEIEGLKVEIVVNAAASPMSASQINANYANYVWPEKVLMKLLPSSPQLFWIQLASYFELQIDFGRSDPYTIEKARFSQTLRDLEQSSSLGVSVVFLPHVFGRGERPERLISSIRNSVFTNSVLRLSSGKQLVPILSVQEVVDILSELTNKDSVHRKESLSSAAPQWYGTIRDLINEISSEVNAELFHFDSEKKTTDEAMPRVEFPHPINVKKLETSSLWRYIENSYI